MLRPLVRSGCPGRGSARCGCSAAVCSCLPDALCSQPSWRGCVRLGGRRDPGGGHQAAPLPLQRWAGAQELCWDAPRLW